MRFRSPVRAAAGCLTIAIFAGCSSHVAGEAAGGDADIVGESVANAPIPAPRVRTSTARISPTEEAKIPYSDLLRYPPNWPEIVEAREGEGK